MFIDRLKLRLSSDQSLRDLKRGQRLLFTESFSTLTFRRERHENVGKRHAAVTLNVA